jgi:CubicO group peptidase (beta-lactamase class C family)
MFTSSQYKYICLYLLLSFGLSLNAIAATFDAASLNEWLLKTHKAHNLAGMTAVIVQDGKVVFNQSYGVIDIDTGVATTPQHLFHMASVSKPVVAVAIMQLVEQGKIKLYEPITQYIPYFKLNDSRLDKVTIQSLLTHTSGMPDEADYQWKYPQTDDQALERWVKQQADKKLLFDPEKNWGYSNQGYEILGDVIAKVSKLSFENYIKKYIFIPLGMKHSTFLRSDIPQSQRVKAHSGILNTYALDFYPYNRRHAPSSSYHTNGDELSLWLNIFSNKKRLIKTGILKSDTINRMWSLPYGERQGWGMALGWFKRINNKRTTYHHGGADDGFRAHMEVYNDRDAGYGFMMNKDHGPIEQIKSALQHATENQTLPSIPRLTENQKVAKLFNDKGSSAIVSYYGEILNESNDEDDLDPVYHLLYELYLSGSFERLEHLSEAITNTYSDQYIAYVYLGHAKYGLNKYKEAMVVAKKALRLNANYASTRTLIDKIKSKIKK